MKWFLACLAAGVVSACGFAPLNLWPLTLIGVALLLRGIETAPGLRSALLRGWGFAVGQFVLGLNWIATAFTYQSNMPHWLGWLAVVLLSLYLAVYPAAAAGLAWRWSGRSRVRLVLVFAAGWIVTEYLRAVMFTGFAWNPLGISLLLTPAATFSALAGTYGLSGLAAVFAGILFLLARRDWREAGSVASAGVILVALAWIATPAPIGEEGAAVRIVQPNISQDRKHDEGYGPQLRRFREASRDADPRPRLQLWPEDGVPFLLDEDPAAVRLLGRWLDPGDLLLTGGFKIERDAVGWAIGARNSTWAVTPNGRVVGRYDKAHLVPYGEYLPMRWLLEPLGLSQVVPGDLDTWEGPGPRTLTLPRFGRVGVQICYEIIFSGQVVERGNRPDFIFNPSNDAWFGAWGPPQHFAQARLRAVEEGLPVLRSTPTGISGIIDARGRVVASLPWNEAGVIDGRVPPAAAPTLFARAGNLMPFLFAALLLLAAIASARLQSRAKRASEGRT
jgi:apolipoprotein N-acyltransferase